MKRIIDWHAVDWTIHDAELARRLKCSRTAVGKARERLGRLPAPKLRKRLPCKKESMARALGVCGKIVAWDRIGVWDYIPAWAADEYNKLVAEAREIISANTLHDRSLDAQKS